MAGVATHLLEPPVNLMRLSLHPDGVAPRIRNLGSWRSHLLHRLERQVAAAGDDELQALLEECRGYPGPEPGDHKVSDLIVPLVYDSPVGVLSMFSTTTVFGSPHEVTTSEIAIEASTPATPRARTDSGPATMPRRGSAPALGLPDWRGWWGDWWGEELPYRALALDDPPPLSTEQAIAGATRYHEITGQDPQEPITYDVESSSPTSCCRTRSTATSAGSPWSIPPNRRRPRSWTCCTRHTRPLSPAIDAAPRRRYIALDKEGRRSPGSDCAAAKPFSAARVIAPTSPGVRP